MPHLSPFEQPVALHPLFRVEARRTRWGGVPGSFRRRSLLTALLWAGVTGAIWAIFGFGLEMTSRGDPFRYGYIRADDIWLLMVALSLLGGGALDFISLFSSVSSISHEITSGRWDLLRLTALNDQGLIAAKQLAAQVRIWPRLMAFVGIRVALVIAGFGLLVRSLTGDMSSNQIAGLVMSVVVLSCIAAVYVMEPFWRVQAMTAFGVYMSVRERHAPTSLLWSFFSLFAIWLLQMLVVGVVAIGVVVLVLVSTSLWDRGTPHLLALCNNIVMIAVFFSAVYGFSHLLERWCLRRALRRIARLN